MSTTESKALLFRRSEWMMRCLCLYASLHVKYIDSECGIIRTHVPHTGSRNETPPARFCTIAALSVSRKPSQAFRTNNHSPKRGSVPGTIPSCEDWSPMMCGRRTEETMRKFAMWGISTITTPSSSTLGFSGAEPRNAICGMSDDPFFRYRNTKRMGLPSAVQAMHQANPSPRSLEEISTDLYYEWGR